MTDIVDVLDRDAFALILRSKTAMGRLVDSEVHSVLDFLESIGFTHHAAQPVADPVLVPIELAPVPVPEVAPIVIAPPPVEVVPAPIAPPPAQ